MRSRIPPVYFCPMCEHHTWLASQMTQWDSKAPRYIPKTCSACTYEGKYARTGADRE